MKKYVMSNTEYKKDSQWNGTNGHNNRLFEVNKNSFPAFTKNNFGTPDLNKKYQEIHKKRQENLKKKLTGNENTFLEIVVAFSLDKFEELEKELSKEELQKRLTDCMNEYLKMLKINFGFEPVGFTFHLDEGHECPETGILKRNVHAHAIAYNYDFEKKVSPLRAMKKKDFSDMQDLVASSFVSLGFERGISKEQTKLNHLEKDAFIEKKNKDLEQKIKEKEQKIKDQDQKIKEQKQELRDKNNEIKKLDKSINTEKKKLTFITDRVVQLANALPHLFSSIFALHKDDTIKWSKVIAGLIPSPKIKNKVIESLDNLAEQTVVNANDMSLMIDLAKDNIDETYVYNEDLKDRIKAAKENKEKEKELELPEEQEQDLNLDYQYKPPKI